tara:strand:- start:162 stop:593 length:432 start_codon:yes stop_codon:yes gene_type:complete
MKEAFSYAKKSMQLGEVPVGAILVDSDKKIIAGSGNSMISSSDPTAHAEINVLRLAGKILKNYRLLDTTLYVTLEPCSMCASALVHARVSKIIYGASDKIAGACGSVFNLVNNKNLNHSIEVHSGVLEDECRKILKTFFSARR